MDISDKLRMQVTRTYLDIISGNITGDKLRALYSYLREQAAYDTLTKDIADFFAHPSKNRGTIKNHIKSEVNEYFANGAKSWVPPTAFSYTEIINDLNLNLKGYVGEISPPDDMVLCIVLFTALQGGHIEFGDKKVYLGFKSIPSVQGITQGEVALIGMMKAAKEKEWMTFSIFSMPNIINCEFVLPHTPDTKGGSMILVEVLDYKIHVFQETPPAYLVSSPSDAHEITIKGGIPVRFSALASFYK